MKLNLIRPWILLLTILLISILVSLVACSSPSTPSPTPATTTTAPPTTSITSPSSTPSRTPSASPSPSPSTSAFTINVASKAGIGNYLVDGKGMTLYFTTRDAVGKSNITGATLNNWPIFYIATPDIVVPSSLNKSDFSFITRDDGNLQTTYKGWPLYYFINDKAPGDTNGNGVAGVWFVINPANFPPTLTPAATPTASLPPAPPPTTSSPAATTTSPAPSAAPASVSIQGFAFNPPTLTVKVGTKVTWTNNDATTHTVTSDTGAYQGTLAPGATFTFTFTQAGTFNYHCSIHTFMTGKVIVQ